MCIRDRSFSGAGVGFDRALQLFWFTDLLRMMLATGDYSLKMRAKLTVRAVGDAVTIRVGVNYFTPSSTPTLLGRTAFSAALSTTMDTTVTLTHAFSVANPESLNVGLNGRSSIFIAINSPSSGSRGVIIKAGSIIMIYLKAT